MSTSLQLIILLILYVSCVECGRYYDFTTELCNNTQSAEMLCKKRSRHLLSVHTVSQMNKATNLCQVLFVVI